MNEKGVKSQETNSENKLTDFYDRPDRNRVRSPSILPELEVRTE